MTERTRQTLLGIFLVGVLALTVLSVALFAGQRRRLVTSLGEPISLPQLGFAVRMPAGWEPGPIKSSRLFSTLVYTRPLDRSARLDGLTQRTPKRQIFFFSVRPGASDEQTLTPLLSLVRLLDMNDNDFYSPLPIEPRSVQVGPYEQREGGFSFRYRRYPYPVALLRYHQITVGRRVFWCVMVGNTQLNQADHALLRAVAASFGLLPEQSV
ncbi:MAG: hypothetical protein GWP14_07085 [Actinobacteria bacterium]|nr:hypothetical protein [Actinomycetota bacterium]